MFRGDLILWQIMKDRKPDAVNLWIGDDKSVTSLHRGEFHFKPVNMALMVSVF